MSPIPESTLDSASDFQSPSSEFRLPILSISDFGSLRSGSNRKPQPQSENCEMKNGSRKTEDGEPKSQDQQNDTQLRKSPTDDQGV